MMSCRDTELALMYGGLCMVTGKLLRAVQVMAGVGAQPKVIDGAQLGDQLSEKKVGNEN